MILSPTGRVRGFDVHCGDSVEYTNNYGQTFLAIVEAVIEDVRPAVLVSRIDWHSSECVPLQDVERYPSVRFATDPADIDVGPAV